MIKELISICIPVYEMHNQGTIMLDRAIQSILSQTYTNWEVIISDHSIDEKIKDCITNIDNSKIKYLRNSNLRGNPSANLNNAINHAEGEFIKPLFQDDFLAINLALAQYIETLKKYPEKAWVVAGTWRYEENPKNLVKPMLPNWNIPDNRFVTGENLIGGPSNI